MGPLAGVRVIEVKSLGPGPYAGMLLADLGAEVIVVERSSSHEGVGLPPEKDIHSRGKKSIVLDLKTKKGTANLLSLAETADILIEGFRPGVAERLGFGPDACLAINPALVYGRITGWGQNGPLSTIAGHDINYVSITGALAAIGGRDASAIPLNLIGDYAGGSLFLVMGVLAALLEARQSGKGQVVDAAMSDGSASLMSLFHSLDAAGSWTPERSSNMLDGGAHFYNVYETADGKQVSIGAIEPRFYALLVEKAGLDTDLFGDPNDQNAWPTQKEHLARIFKTRSRDEWCAIFAGTDACFAPVLNYREAPSHPHNVARETYLTLDGVTQPAPTPRFSRSDLARPTSPRKPGSDTEDILAELKRAD